MNLRLLSLILIGILSQCTLQAQGTRQWLLPPGQALPPSWDAGAISHRFSSGWSLVQLPEELDSRLSAQYEQEWEASGAEPDRLWVATGFPDDPALSLQWAFGGSHPHQRVDIHAKEAWNLATDAGDVIVGVLDSGVDWTHPDLIDNIWQNLGEDADGDGRVLEYIGGQWVFDPGDINGIDDDGNGYVDDFIGWDFVNNDNNPYDDHYAGHGTHVAGIIGASGNNGIGVTGVAWSVKIMPLKFLDQSGKGYTSGAIEALEYARKMGADLTNNSWGAPFRSEALATAIDSSAAAGQLFVAAAGNNFGNDNDQNLFYPASFSSSHVVSVTATNPLGERSVFANTGKITVDIGAPGTGIYSTLPGNQYGFFSGTSMAAPFVTGALALLRAVQPALSPEAMTAKLIRSTDPLPTLLNACQGQGQLNLWKLLRRPFRFDKASDMADYGAPILTSNGSSYLLGGNNPDAAWISAFSAPGQIAWPASFDTGVRVEALLPAGDSGWMAGGTQGQASWVQQFDLSGAQQWAYALYGPDAPRLAAMTLQNDRLLVAGHFDNGNLWIAGMDNPGMLAWQHRFATSGQKIYLLDTPSDLFMLVDHWDGFANRFALLRFSSSGQYQGARVWNITDADRVEATGLHPVFGDDDEWTLGLLVIRPGGDREIWIWEGEDKLEPEKGFGYALSPATQTAFTEVRVEGGWIIASTDTLTGATRLISTDVNAALLFATAFISDFRISGLAAAYDGGVAMAGIAGSGDSASWVLRKTDPRGLGNCPGAGVVPASIGVPLLTGQSLSLTPDNPGLSLAPQVMASQPQTAQATERCGANPCETEAFFLLPPGLLCGDDSLFIPSLSQQATSYEWRVNGIPVSTDSILAFEVDDDEYVVSLTAISGNCSDEMSLRFDVEPGFNIPAIDTTRCGAGIWLEAPIKADSYQWRDNNENLLSTASRLRITQSGQYKLAMIDGCGNSHDQEIDVTLVGDCVWPGDVNADGAVDQLDFLLLGLVHGQTGPARPNPGSQYQEQPAITWAGSFSDSLRWAPGVNLQHADCDGDGLIDIALDGQVIRQNRTSPFIPPTETAPASLSLILNLPQGQANLGDTIPLSVALVDTSGQSPPIYGLTFSIRYNLPLNEGIIFSFPPSWMGTNGLDLSSLAVEKSGPNASEVSLVRFDLQNRVGQGALIAGGIIIQIDDIGSYAFLGQQAYLSLDLLDAFAIQADGSRVPIHEIRVQGNQTVRINVPIQELDLRVALQGAWDTVALSHTSTLHSLGLLPVSSPYPQAPGSYFSAAGAATDWVMLEFRDTTDMNGVVSRMAGLLLPNGKVVDPGTRRALRPGIPDGAYYLVLRHRNHLAIRSPMPLNFVSGIPVDLDWTTSSLPIDGQAQLLLRGNTWAIPAGDVNQDGRIIWSGQDNDQQFLLRRLQGQPQNSLFGYFAEDLNLDGYIRYQGPESDRTLFQQTFQGLPVNQIIQSYVP